jgi:hypothetical protein
VRWIGYACVRVAVRRTRRKNGVVIRIFYLLVAVIVIGCCCSVVLPFRVGGSAREKRLVIKACAFLGEGLECDLWLNEFQFDVKKEKGTLN